MIMLKKVFLLICLLICFSLMSLSQSSFLNDNFYQKIIAKNSSTLSNLEQTSITLSDTLQKASFSSWRLTKEVGLGAITGATFGLMGAQAANLITGGSGYGGLLGFFPGVTIGSSVGVYLAAKKDKPDISLLNTIAFGMAGSGVGYLITRLNTHDDIIYLVPVILPLVFSIIYVELLE